MKTYFRKKECPRCHLYFDPTEGECSHCGEPNRDFERGNPFEHHLRDIFPWQIAYFLIGWLGFQALGITLQLIIQIGYQLTHANATKEQIVDFMGQVGVNFAITGTAYLVLLGVFILILCLRKKMYVLLKSFKNWAPYLIGLAGGFALLGISIGYGLISDAVLKALNVTPSVNQNESAIRAMVQALPVLSILIFGIIGPFCEEITYRVGLFGLASRLGKVLAYVISALVFAFIHFGWDVLFTGVRDDIIIEFVNIPSYILAGVGLAFLYDRFGLCASFTAHTVNNLVSVVVQLVAGGNA